MCCHTFHCCPPELNCSVLLPCYLGLEIKRLSCCCHAVCLQCLNASVSWCLHLTTFWQLPNKMLENQISLRGIQATSVMMTNHFTEQWEGKKGVVLWLSVFLLRKSTTSYTGQITYKRHHGHSCSCLTNAALLLYHSARIQNWIK